MIMELSAVSCSIGTASSMPVDRASYASADCRPKRMKAAGVVSVGEVWACEASRVAPLDGCVDVASIEERQAEVEAARVCAQGANKIGIDSDAGEYRVV